MQNDYLKNTLAHHNQYLESSNHIAQPQYSMPTSSSTSSTTAIISSSSYHDQQHQHQQYQQQQQYINGGLSNTMLSPNMMNTLPPHHIQLK